MSNITAAKQARDNLRVSFDARTAVRWAVESETLDADLHRAVWDAFDKGTSVAQICREYGTKDRGTIYKILRLRDDVSILPACQNTHETQDAREALVVADQTARSRGYEGALRISVANWPADKFASPIAAAAVMEQYHNRYSGYVVVYARGSNANITYRFVAGSVEHPGGPLQQEIIYNHPDSNVMRALADAVRTHDTEVTW